ncbi:hypothetical protein CHS0354_039120, partial [Potamilus streckersoni]
MQHLIQFDSKDPYLDNAAWVLIGVGVFVLLVGGFGFFAAATQNKCFLVMYIGSLVIIFIGELGGGITAAVFKSQVEDGMNEILLKTFKEYKKGNLIAKAWDYMQVWLTCCGAGGYMDYRNNRVNFTENVSIATIFEISNNNEKLTGENIFVPKSCCVLTNDDPENPQPKNLMLCQNDAHMNTTKSEYLKTE